MSSGFGVIMHDDHELIGATIAGRYRIISRLGAGGMGVAYRAWDEQAGVPVVIKIPKRIFLEDPKFAERFQRETRLLQGLKHAHIVPIVDVGEHEGLPFVVMRFLPGGSLSNRRLRDDQGRPRPNPPAMLHLWLPAIAEALDYVHSHGVVHRDVKPANIFFDAFWGTFLGDFGIAKIVEESDSFDKEHTLTATHMGIGTQEYMAPEQFTPKAAIDGRADQYSLGVMVYEMLAGKRPFTGETAHLVVEVTTYAVPPLPVRRSDVSPLVVQAVHRALSKQPAERFATCREFAAAVLRNVPPMRDEPGVARLLCPQCSNILKLPTVAAGQKGKCPKCQTQMKVAQDLGALWLLDEARKQRKATAVDSDASPITPNGEIDEKALETFKPISSETPIGPVGKRGWPKPAWIYAAGAVAIAIVVLVLFPGKKAPPPPPPIPPSYEERLAEALKTIEQSPSDPDATDFLARHYCFKERNWQQGLAYLAKSGMPDAAALATEEIAALASRPVNAGTVVRLARKWWDYGLRRDINTPESTAATQIHASDLYRKYVTAITDPSDADWSNAWLDGDKVFAQFVKNVRPPATDNGPFRLAVNGIGGKQFLRPRTFGSDWLGFNPSCNGTEKAWEKDGEFAQITAKGAMEWPSLPVNRYVCEFEITFNGRERDLKICIGDPWDATQIFFDFVKERNAIECTHRVWRHGSWGWAGHRDFVPNRRYSFAVVIDDGRQVLLEAGKPVLGVADSWPTDCRLRIWSGTESGTIIHTISFRPLTEAYARMANIDMPPSTVEGQPDLAAKRIELLVKGLGGLPEAGKRFKAAATGSPMVWITPGQFEMGSQHPGDVRRQTVRLTRGFWIGQTEVSQRDYERVMGLNPGRIRGSVYLPVDWVSWEDCQEYCRRLNDAARKAGTLLQDYEYRLPTEAEWEYCCRAGSPEDFSVPNAGVWGRDTSGRRPREVAASEPNAWGIYDMHGNAMEWCLDRWYDYPGRTTILQTDPHYPGKPERESFVVRGGAWWASQASCSSHWRSLCTNNPAGGYRGFRVALAPVQQVIRDKTLVAWATLANLTQQGGGVLSLEDPRNEFDAIVFGEAEPGRWLAGSDWAKRWPPTPAALEKETARPSDLVQIAIVYSGSSIALYRNGVLSTQYDKDAQVPFAVASSRVSIGCRDIWNAYGLFAGEVDDARIYNVALTVQQIRDLKPNKASDVKPLGWWHFESGTLVDAAGTFNHVHTFGNAHVRGGRLILDGKQAFVVFKASTPPVPEKLLKEQLLVDFSDPNSEPGRNGLPARGQPLDLLRLANPVRDAVWGTWKMVGGELESGGERAARLRFPVRPPRDYEFTIEFTKLSGQECVGQCCTSSGNGFFALLGGYRNTLAGLELLDWRDVGRNATVQRRDAWLESGKRHISTVRVRQNHVTMILDGKEILSLPLDWKRVGHHPAWAIPEEMLGLGSWESPTRFHRASLLQQ